MPDLTVAPPKVVDAITLVNDTTMQQDHISQWVESCLKALDIEHKHKKHPVRWDRRLIIENFPPEHYVYYQKLQEAIADRIPTESNRPTILLKIRGKNRVNSHTVDYAYLGGTGPLSDAGFLGGLVQSYTEKSDSHNLDNFCGDLLSAPPPRKIHSTSHINFYYDSLNIHLFERSNAPRFVLLSNTAHLNFATVSWMLGEKRHLKHHDQNAEQVLKKMDHLVDGIVNNIAADASADNILVCGTKAAYQKKLYPTKLAPHKITTSSPNADQLQAIIDLIKGGKANIKIGSAILKQHKCLSAMQDLTVGEALVTLIMNNIKKSHEKGKKNFSHILLSCTEIPLCFHTPLPRAVANTYKLSDNPTYNSLFEHLFKSSFPEKKLPIIIDTEKQMADLVATQQLVWQNKHTKPAAQPMSSVRRSIIMSKQQETLLTQSQNITNIYECLGKEKAKYDVENLTKDPQSNHFNFHLKVDQAKSIPMRAEGNQHKLKYIARGVIADADFGKTAHKLARIAVDNCKPRTDFKLSQKLTTDQKAIMANALETAIEEAVKANKFDNDNKPTVGQYAAPSAVEPPRSHRPVSR